MVKVQGMVGTYLVGTDSKCCLIENIILTVPPSPDNE